VRIDLLGANAIKSLADAPAPAATLSKPGAFQKEEIERKRRMARIELEKERATTTLLCSDRQRA
jgi:hypothetical protein